MTRALLLLLLVVAGCANNGRQELEARLVPLVGVTEDELLRRVGVPNRTADSGDRRFLAYTNTWTDVVGGPMVGIGGFYGAPGWGYGWGWGAPPVVVDRTCDITFELAAGRVTSFTLRGNSCGWGNWPMIAPP